MSRGTGGEMRNAGGRKEHISLLPRVSLRVAVPASAAARYWFHSHSQPSAGFMLRFDGAQTCGFLPIYISWTFCTLTRRDVGNSYKVCHGGKK